MTTAEIKLNFLAPAPGDRLIVKGRIIKVGITLCLGEALIEDEKGSPLAHGTSTMMAIREVTIKESSAFPPTFLEWVFSMLLPEPEADNHDPFQHKSHAKGLLVFPFVNIPTSSYEW